MKLFMVKTKCGYWDFLEAGIIEAKDKKDAERIAKEWAAKHGKPDHIAGVDEVCMLDFDKPPY